MAMMMMMVVLMIIGAHWWGMGVNAHKSDELR